MYEPALIMAKYACEMCPESTNAWVLLARCYFLNDDYQKALMALDMTPVYAEVSYIDTYSEKSMNEYESTKPDKRNTTDCFSKIMGTQKLIEFEVFSYLLH